MANNNSSDSGNDNEPRKDKLEETYDFKTDDFLNDVKSSLSTQVNEALNSDPENSAESDKQEKVGKKGPGKGFKTLTIAILALAFVAVLLVSTDFGKSLIIRMISAYSYHKLDYDETPEETTEPEEEVVEQVTPTAAPQETTPKPDHISNILLIGMETFEGALNTDTMIIASLDSKNNVIKLTSLMRDLYVKIPGHSNGKLNSVYAREGIQGLYDTIKLNFEVEMDGYVLVDFKDFERVIDYLGGVEITLTRREANYLNSTNYISNPAYRNVVAGTQHMNGNQVLGYCRIRKVPTATESNDFGRTQRQRIVLEKIFEKMRSKNIIQLGLIMNKILNNIDIKTDISKEEYNNYLQQAVYLKENAIQTLRIPTDDNYTDESYSGANVKDVLVPKSWDRTRKDIHEFIYGTE